MFFVKTSVLYRIMCVWEGQGAGKRNNVGGVLLRRLKTATLRTQERCRCKWPPRGSRRVSRVIDSSVGGNVICESARGGQGRLICLVGVRCVTIRNDERRHTHTHSLRLYIRTHTLRHTLTHTLAHSR